MDLQSVVEKIWFGWDSGTYSLLVGNLRLESQLDNIVNRVITLPPNVYPGIWFADDRASPVGFGLRLGKQHSVAGTLLERTTHPVKTRYVKLSDVIAPASKEAGGALLALCAELAEKCKDPLSRQALPLLKRFESTYKSQPHGDLTIDSIDPPEVVIAELPLKEAALNLAASGVAARCWHAAVLDCGLKIVNGKITKMQRLSKCSFGGVWLTPLTEPLNVFPKGGAGFESGCQVEDVYALLRPGVPRVTHTEVPAAELFANEAFPQMLAQLAAAAADLHLHDLKRCCERLARLQQWPSTMVRIWRRS